MDVENEPINSREMNKRRRNFAVNQLFSERLNFTNAVCYQRDDNRWYCVAPPDRVSM